MDNSTLFSRRDTDRKVDFSPDLEKGSPNDQARRLSGYLRKDESHIFTEENITDCPQALDALREYSYRKIFTGTSHADFVRLDQECPEHIDWTIRVHEIESANHQAKRGR